MAKHHREEGVEKESVSSSEDQELPLLGGWLGITVGRKELESSDSDLMAGTGRKEEFLAPESEGPFCCMLGQEIWVFVETDC